MIDRDQAAGIVEFPSGRCACLTSGARRAGSDGGFGKVEQLPPLFCHCLYVCSSFPNFIHAVSFLLGVHHSKLI